MWVSAGKLSLPVGSFKVFIKLAGVGWIDSEHFETSKEGTLWGFSEVLKEIYFERENARMEEIKYFIFIKL